MLDLRRMLNPDSANPSTWRPPALPGDTYVRPAWARSWRWKSSPKLTTAKEGKCNCARVTERGKEAWNESASRWTRIGYEAMPTRASRRNTAKLLWSRGGSVNPAVVRRKIAFLPGETSPCARKGDRASGSEESAEAILANASW